MTYAWPGVAYPGVTYPGDSGPAADAGMTSHVRVAVAFGTDPDDPAPAWVDLTSRLDLVAGVDISRGRPDQHGVVQPGKLSLTLDNTDGALTPGLVSSVFYPDVKPQKRIRCDYRDPAIPGNFLTANQASMETDVSDWFSNTAFGSLDTATLSSSTTHPYTGSKGGLATWPTTSIGSMAMTSVVGLTIGRRYTASCRVYVPSGSPDVIMNCLLTATGTSTAIKNALTPVSVTFTATSTSHVVGPLCFTASSGQQCWWDGVRVDEAGVTDQTTFTATPPAPVGLFDGHVDEWPVEWPNGGKYTQSRVSASDVLARIGSRQELRSVVEETILLSGPTAYYPLGEPDTASTCGDISATPGTGVLSLFQTGAGGSVTFGAGTGPGTDGLTAIVFTPASSTNGQRLVGTIAPVGGFFGTGLTLKVTFASSTAAVQTIAQVTTLYGVYITLDTDASGHVVAKQFDPFAGGGAFTLTSANVFTDGSTHDAAVSLSRSGDTVTVRLVVDGVDRGNTTYSAPWGFHNYSILRAGGSQKFNLFTGTLSHVAVFPTGLSVSTLAEQRTSTTTGFAGERSDQRVARILSWAGIPTTRQVLDVGQSTSVAFIDPTGKSPLSLAQDVTSTEQGVLFADPDGNVVFYARNRAYTITAVTASVDAGEVGVDTQPKMDLQGVLNDMDGTRPDGAKQRVIDQASGDEFGWFQDTFDPLVTTDQEVLDALSWLVNAASQPIVRVPELTLDLLTGSAPADVRALDVWSRLQTTGMPSQAPAAGLDLTVQGYRERISETEWSRTVNVTDYNQIKALVYDDPASLYDSDFRYVY